MLTEYSTSRAESSFAAALLQVRLDVPHWRRLQQRLDRLLHVVPEAGHVEQPFVVHRLEERVDHQVAEAEAEERPDLLDRQIEQGFARPRCRSVRGPRRSGRTRGRRRSCADGQVAVGERGQLQGPGRSDAVRPVVGQELRRRIGHDVGPARRSAARGRRPNRPAAGGRRRATGRGARGRCSRSATPPSRLRSGRPGGASAAGTERGGVAGGRSWGGVLRRGIRRTANMIGNRSPRPRSRPAVAEPPRPPPSPPGRGRAPGRPAAEALEVAKQHAREQARPGRRRTAARAATWRRREPRRPGTPSARPTPFSRGRAAAGR